MRISPARIISASLLGGLLAWLIAWRPFSADRQVDPSFLEIMAASPADGTLVLRVDEGHGYADDRPSDLAVRIHRSATPLPLRLPMPPGRIRALKGNVFETPTLSVQSAQLRTVSGGLIAKFDSADLKPWEGSEVNASGALTDISAATGQTGFAFEIRPERPITVPSENEPRWWEALGTWIAASGLLLLAGALLERRLPWERLRALSVPVMTAIRRQVILTLSMVALAATIVSSAPVIFGGKSFVSPNTGAHLLYFRNPTLPNAPVEPPEEVKGSDVACIFWCDIPFTKLVGKALFHDGELPLWNRMDACGVPLLGQAQSMIGDPVGLIPLLAGSAWWAWDIKFLLAKTLFALGMGLCVHQVTRRLGLAALVAASSAWIGFFAFRFNHPAFFSVSYAPWILLPWLAWREGGTRGKLLLSAFGLLLADWAELNSGTAKEASMLLAGMNAAGLLALVLETRAGIRGALRRAAPLLWTSLLFLMVSAPLWMVFLDALKRSVTIYDAPRALQLPAGDLLGLFDGLFSQDATRLENHLHPSMNFLMLAGVLWFAASGVWRRNRLAAALGLACLPPMALVFGVVPERWIVATPFLGNIIHIHNTFACVLVVLLPLLAAIGLQEAWDETDAARWRKTAARSLAGLAALLAAYGWWRSTLPPVPGTTLPFMRALPSQFFLVYASIGVVAAALFPLAWRGLRERRGWAWSLALVALVVMHFRHGMYEETKFDAYVMNPRAGYNLEAESMALDRVQRRLKEPYRTTGFSAVLTPGYNGLLELEGIAGADALENRYYRELCQAAKLAKADWRLIVPEGTLEDRKPIYDLLNLRFYLREPTNRPAPEKLQNTGTADLEILESKEAWPRAFFTNRVKTHRTPEELVEQVKQGDGRPFASFTDEAAGVAAGDLIAAASDYRFTTNTTSFTVKAPAPGVAVLGETFEEGNFRVTVNGAPATYRRVNHAFKAVDLPAAGDYRIVFSYWPRVLTPALWLAALGLVLTACSVVVLLARRTKLTRVAELQRT